MKYQVNFSTMYVPPSDSAKPLTKPQASTMKRSQSASVSVVLVLQDTAFLRYPLRSVGPNSGEFGKIPG